MACREFVVIALNKKLKLLEWHRSDICQRFSWLEYCLKSFSDICGNLSYLGTFGVC